MDDLNHGLWRTICQNCATYKRPKCLNKDSDREFVKRKDTCSYFKNKRPEYMVV